MQPFYRWLIVIAFVLGSAIFLLAYSPSSYAEDDPVLVGAGDIGNCGSTRDSETAALLDNIAGTVFTLGDNVYEDGTTAQFTDCYAPTWGRHKARTMPVPGNHDYHTSGGAGYYAYFGSIASPLDNNCTKDCKGYYSYDLGAWHIIALNSEIAISAGSEQEQWLRADLAAHNNVCTLAYWHEPRFSSGQHGNDTSTQPLWNALYEFGADVVLNGHDHDYERFAPQNPNGQVDPVSGIREFVVGTGGTGLRSFATVKQNSEVRNSSTHGVFKLTLHATSYDWEFVPVAGQTFQDSGSADCVGSDSSSTPTYTPTPTNTPESVPTETSTPTPTNTPESVPTETSTPTPIPSQGSGDVLFVGSSSGGKVIDVSFSNEDVLSYDSNTGQWLKFFDGSDVASTEVDLDAFARLADGSLLFSLKDEASIDTLGQVEDIDIIRFVPSSLDITTTGTLEWYFDGSVVGLTRGVEDVDALTVLSDGRLVLSTRGSFAAGGITGHDEDLMAFTPSPLGQTTEGTWSLYFNGSDVGLISTYEDIRGLWIDPANGDIYLTTKGDFAVDGVSGTSGDIFVCAPNSLGNDTSCTFRMYWSGSANGFDKPIDTLDISKGVQPELRAMLDDLRIKADSSSEDVEAAEDNEEVDDDPPDEWLFLPQILP